jgi:hypothetical protein
VVVIPPSPPAEAPAPAEPVAKGGRKHRRGSEDGKPDPAHRKIDIPAEPTPAELKNPFAQ